MGRRREKCWVVRTECCLYAVVCIDCNLAGQSGRDSRDLDSDLALRMSLD